MKNKSNNYVVRARFNHSYMGNIITAITLADKELNALNCRLLLDGISLYRDDGYKAQNYNFSYIIIHYLKKIRNIRIIGDIITKVPSRLGIKVFITRRRSVLIITIPRDMNNHPYVMV